MRVIITCNVLEGDQPIRIRWLVNGEPIDINKYLVDHTPIGDLGSVLVFNRVDQRHNGNYSCVAANEAGDTVFTTPMVVKG